MEKLIHSVVIEIFSYRQKTLILYIRRYTIFNEKTNKIFETYLQLKNESYYFLTSSQAPKPDTGFLSQYLYKLSLYILVISIIQSKSVCLYLKISVTAELIGLYSY